MYKCYTYYIKEVQVACTSRMYVAKGREMASVQQNRVRKSFACKLCIASDVPTVIYYHIIIP